MTAFERYVAAGGARRGFWRPLLGLAVIGVMWVGGTAGTLLLWTAINTIRFGDAGAAAGRLNALFTGGPEAVTVVLMTFAGIWIGVFLAASLLHRQRFRTLFAPDGRVRGGDLLRGLTVAALFATVSTLAGLLVVGPATPALPLPAWLAFLAPVIAGVCLQATAEELIFRGYLLQQLALRSRSPLVWAVLPSAMFGALHWSGTMPPESAAIYVATTFLMGLALATLVWRTGSLWASIGLHVGFNLVGLTVVGTEGVLAGPQLFLFTETDLMPLMWIDLATTAALLVFVLSPLAPFGPRRLAGEA